MARQPLGGLGRLNFWGFTITHSATPHSVGFLWTSDQPVAETSTWQHTTLQETDIHALGGIRPHNPSKRAAVDPIIILP
jgi:dihydroorotase